MRPYDTLGVGGKIPSNNCFCTHWNAIILETSWDWAKPSSVSSLVSTRLRFTASSKMDLDFPHGPQKIEILRKLDPLHVKSYQKNFETK